MFKEYEMETLAEQGLIGAIVCSENGSIVECTSDDLEVFGNILGYVTQIANMIGESFGLDEVEQVHIKTFHTLGVCVPQDGSSLGLLCKGNANVDKILDQMSE